MSLVSEHQIVRDAVTRRENAERQLSQAQARLAGLRERYSKERAILVNAVQDDKVPSGFLRLETSTRRAELEVEIADEALGLARQAEIEAYEHARKLVQRKLTRAYRDAVALLDQALATAADSNTEVLRIHNEIQAEIGSGWVSPLYWPELLPETDRHQSRLRQWRKAAGLEQPGTASATSEMEAVE